MSKAIIHVNRQHIAYNAKVGEDVLPVYTTKPNGPNSKPVYSYGVRGAGPFELVDPRTHSQLSCGARAWIETEGEVEFVEPMDFAAAKRLKKRFEKLNTQNT